MFFRIQTRHAGDPARCRRTLSPVSRTGLHDLPDRAWAKVGVDLFHFNQADYMLCVDYFSKFPEIAKLTQTTSQHVITALKSIFTRHGIPDEVVSVGPYEIRFIFSQIPFYFFLNSFFSVLIFLDSIFFPF